MSPRALVLTLGGTISMSGTTAGGVAPSLGSADLLGAAPTDVDVDARDLCMVPGAHLTLADVLAVAGAVDEAAELGYHGVVVVQGTDTIEETAYALDLLADPRVVTVVTGAMRNASAVGADGPANLADALTAAADASCRGAGTFVVMGGWIHAASFVRKASTAAPDAFESHPGPLGVVQEGRAHLLTVPRRRKDLRPFVPRREEPSIAMVTALLGQRADALAHLRHQRPAGVIVEGFGGGHLPPDWVAPLAELAARIPVVLTSRTRRGLTLATTYEFAGSERDLLRRGLIGAGHLDAPKVAMALRLLLVGGADRTRVASFFESALES